MAAAATAATAEPAIETRRLCKRYGDRLVVDGLDLAVPAGIVFGFLGANGAGKSTTLRMLCGFLRPTSGEARVAGFSPQHDRARLKQVMGFMPQAFGLYDHLTVRENIQFYGNLYLRSRREVKARGDEVLGLAGLEPYLGQPAAKLSAGWRQRLALACAILHRPKVLFLDEPTAGVDPVSRRMFWDLIHVLNDNGATIFVTTHHMEEVERCHQVGLLHGGVLRVHGSPHELKAATASRFDLWALDCDEPERALSVLRADPALHDAYLYGERIHLAWAAGGADAPRTRDALAQARVPVRLLQPRPPTMEDVFVAATEGAK